MKSCFILFSVVLFFGCRQKKKQDEVTSKFISVLSLIEEQVAHIDTSLYSIMKIVYTDSLHADSSYIPREQFREVAKDFLSIPDLSDPTVAKRYKEDPVQYDQLLNRVIITYTPVDPEKETIKKQELLVTPNASGDKVSNIMISRLISNRDSLFKQDMLWLMDKSFQVVSTIQKPAKPAVTTITKVIWNEDTEK